MTERPDKQEKKPKASASMVVGACTLLLVFIGWLYYHTFVPPSFPTGPTKESKHDWIAQLAIKTGGDPGKLDPAMRQRLDMYTGGHAAALLKSKLKAALEP